LFWRCAATSFLALLHLLRKVLSNIINEMEVKEILLRLNTFDHLREFRDLIIHTLIFTWVDTFERLWLINAIHVWLLFAAGLVFLIHTLLVLVTC
jgi:hypothetical protein